MTGGQGGALGVAKGACRIDEDQVVFVGAKPVELLCELRLATG
jgi:hypothetical protein